jgi:arylsulfatase A-like enzyme
MPRNVIVVLLDSLNRHMLGCYGGNEFTTPNLDAFAARSTKFENHVTGSLPCMPARHDILCGALDFLWKPWGSIEVWEDPVTYALRHQEVTTMLVSDHPHLFEVGGENYHTDFDGWEYLRGHESDLWHTVEDPSYIGAPALPAQKARMRRGSDFSRTWFRSEDDFPGPKTMKTAAQWLDRNAGQHDRFMLFVDEFDPHEPFDTPLPWADRYDPDWEGERIIWPTYSSNGVASGALTEREARHLRANYGSKLSMIDHWFGRVIDSIDRNGLWDDTAIIVCTDHGHYLGEKDIFGKPAVMQYEPLGHTPLLVSWPGTRHGSVDALTTNVDIHATICDIFDIEPEHVTHGRSLVPVLEERSPTVREWAIGGVFGKWVQVTDGSKKYARAPEGNGFPLSMWSNRWTTMPVHARPNVRLPRPDRRAYLDFMPGSESPVIRQPFHAGDRLPFWALNPPVGEHHLFDLTEDPEENHDLTGTRLEAEMIDLLRVALVELEAPQEQLERLAIA